MCSASLRVQAGIVGNLDTNRIQTSALVTSSQGASGALQAGIALFLLVAQAPLPTGDTTIARAEATGTTVIRFTVDATGKLASADVVKSAGPTREHRLLDRVAVTKLSECRFTPGRDAEGRPIGGSFNVEYVWKLQ